jgi:hypothetical protein
MHRHATFMLLSLGYAASVAAQPFVPAYEMKGSPAFQAFNQALKEDRVLDALAADASAVFELPRPVTVTVAECGGKTNAHYRRLPGRPPEIRLCFELFAQVAQWHADAIASGKTPPPGADSGALSFIFMHEVGHALVDQLRLELPGDAEDAADTIATYIFLRGDGSDVSWLDGALWYFGKDGGRGPRHRIADTHAPDAQRLANVVCLAFGKDSQRYARWAGQVLSLSRSAQCAREYQRVDGWLRAGLGTRFKPAVMQDPARPAMGGVRIFPPAGIAPGTR